MRHSLGTIKRLIFLTETQFCLRDYQRFGIEILQKNGFDVEVWDLSQILHPSYFANYTPLDTVDYRGLTLFSGREELYRKFSQLTSSDFIINIVTYNVGNLEVFKLASQSRSGYAAFYANAIPDPVIKRSWLEEKLKWLASLRYLKTWERLYMNLPLRWINLKAPKIIFGGGNESITCYRKYYNTIGADTEVLFIHTLDYDLYLAQKEAPYVEKNTAVFLDEYGPFHPDFAISDEDVFMDADSYYPKLNILFDRLEEETGLEVVIAAHPRSRYEDHPDYFNGRRCLRGETINLVKECKLVLTHCSSAVNFANLFLKPVIFMTSVSLGGTYADARVKQFARYFGKKAVFMEEYQDIDFRQEMRVSRQHYDSYKRAFIKIENSEDLPFWQVVADRLRKP